MYPLLQDGAKIVSDVVEHFGEMIDNLGGVTPEKVNGIIVVKEKDAYLAELLMPLLGLSMCWLIKDSDSYYETVRAVRNPQRCRFVIASTSVNNRNQKNLERALRALEGKVVVKSASVFAFFDSRPKEDRGRFEVVTARRLKPSFLFAFFALN
ncbi:MAG: hypothetical protein WC468_00680 [Candidatus Paceibacterota bacterium]